VPGVHVGKIDVSGLNRTQVIDKLRDAYASLNQGEITVTTPVGTAKITYQDAGRKPDLEAMADAAMSVGHSGNAIGDVVTLVHTTLSGQTVPVVVAIDPTVLANRIHPLAGISGIDPKDASVADAYGTFKVVPAELGHGIDERAIATEIIDRLTRADAPSTFSTGGTFVDLQPQVDDKAAQAAVTAAQKMSVSVTLVWSVPTSGASASASPTPAVTPSPGASSVDPKTFTIDAATIHSWITFGFRADGTYGPSLDPSKSQPYLADLLKKVATPPVEPDVVYGADGKPASLKAGKDGVGVDVGLTTHAIETYLDGMVAGSAPASPIAIATNTITPKITLDTLKNFVLIGDGTWTTQFYPDVSNGNGANIKIPSKLLNGQVVQPGQQFSFLNAVGPIDFAHGYAMGGVITGGKSDHTGAIGGGICSASTTMFNAAMRAGLQIDERHPHFYYIDRYPAGLDATVYSNGWETWDLKWTNDTPNPIIIRSSTTRVSSKSTITVQLWSLPLDRKVELNGVTKSNMTYATDSKKFVTSLPPGQTAREEFPANGYDITRTRLVTDSSGKTIHQDTWNSHYSRVDGILWVGVAAAPTPAPPAAAVPVTIPAMVTPSTVTVSQRRAG